MNPSEDVEQTVRLFLQRGNEPDYRCLAWFQLAGHDFYWGPAQDGPDVPAVPFSGTELTIELPEDLAALPGARWKASRHASGMMHINTSGRDTDNRNDVYVGPPTRTSRPTRFAVAIEKPADQIPPYRRSLTRRGGRAAVVRLSDELWTRRTYWEFFLSPPGTWPAPPFAMNGLGPDQPLVMSLGPGSDLSLVIRHGLLAATNGPHPELGFWLNLQDDPITDI